MGILYDVHLKYSNKKLEKPNTQKQNFVWFNLPFSKPISTNVAITFLQLTTKLFQRRHKLTKLPTTIQLKSATAALTI